MKWMDSIDELKQLETKEDRRRFLLNLVCFATCIEGLFFFAAFAYVLLYARKACTASLAVRTGRIPRRKCPHGLRF